ncbi:amyloid-beta A4 precursor protein-binding family A member 3 [Lacerta agilis]|uniref:amyloid-beta A4 precursor protein-binding family A member 3 n=1 Tax=Lacerta agilis TaxID=80427 RepID=UPI00141A1624|nr:amyloid-beta A4 precursor protein-binding family A member 3 [Lacerta agilis]
MSGPDPACKSTKTCKFAKLLFFWSLILCSNNKKLFQKCRAIPSPGRPTMTDSEMDFKSEAILVTGTGTDPPETLSMDLEEGPATDPGAPGKPRKETPSDWEQPSPSPGSLQAPVPKADSRICDPAAPETQSGSDIAEGSGWLLNPPDSSPQGYKQAVDEGCRQFRTDCETRPLVSQSGGLMEASPEPVAGEPGWTPGPQEEALGGSDPEPAAGADPAELLVEMEDADIAQEGESDHLHLHGLLTRLQRLSPSFEDRSPTSEDGLLPASDGEEGRVSEGDGDPLLSPGECRGPPGACAPCPLHIATGHGLGVPPHSRRGKGLLSVEVESEDLLSLLRYERGPPAEAGAETPLARSDAVAGSSRPGGMGPGELASDRAQGEGPRRCKEPLSSSSDSVLGGSSPEPSWRRPAPGSGREEEASCSSDVAVTAAFWITKRHSKEDVTDPDPLVSLFEQDKADLSSLPTYKEVPGPCEPEDLLDGVIFGAKYLGSTQLVSERNPPTHVRMAQAQKAVDRIKAPEGESQPMTEVDLFISTQRIKVLTADSQEAMMDHLLQTISYIADIGNIVVLMARRKLPRRAEASAEKQLYKMICHVFHSADAPLIAQAIGQAFSVAYQQFLRASGIDPDQLHPRRCSDDEGDESFVQGEELYNGDLAHFSKQENCKEVVIHKQKGEILGIVIVESGWGSILPTVVVANLMHKGAAERSGKLSIGDRIMSANGTSLVGLPLASCQGIIRDLKSQTVVSLSVVHCPPVTTAIVRRPDAKYPLGFCVENGIICSLMRGGIAERGGIRVGHRIIEINGQSVVAMPHEKIIQILTQAVSEVHIKTMPASTYRLLTGQEQPVFL